VLLVDGQRVASIRRHGLEFKPAYASGGKGGQPLRVRMEAPTLEYQLEETNTTHSQAKQDKVKQCEKDIQACKATLRELEQALPRSHDAFQQAVDRAAAGDESELSDIGAMALEQKRIQQEIEKQRKRLSEKQQLLPQLESALVPLLLRDCRVTPSFDLRRGWNELDVGEAQHGAATRTVVVQLVYKEQFHTVPPIKQ
jgi:chromosome segregation ATPase